jgi:hypothetical protein
MGGRTTPQLASLTVPRGFLAPIDRNNCMSESEAKGDGIEVPPMVEWALWL